MTYFVYEDMERGFVWSLLMNERPVRLSVIIVLLIAVIACMIISLIWGSTPVSLAEDMENVMV